MDNSLLQLWSLVGTALGIVLVVTVMAWGCKQTIRQVRDIWLELRHHQKMWLAAVDEPDDVLVRRLAALSSLPPEAWTAFLTAFLQALAGAMDALVASPQAPVEADISAGGATPPEN